VLACRWLIVRVNPPLVHAVGPKVLKCSISTPQNAEGYHPPASGSVGFVSWVVMTGPPLGLSLAKLVGGAMAV